MVIITPYRPSSRPIPQTQPHIVNAKASTTNIVPANAEIPTFVGDEEVLLPSFFVATNGSDGNSGTSESSPFLTLTQARDAMRSDGTRSRVYIRGGTYDLTGTLNLNANDNNTSWLAYPNETPVIDLNNITLGFNLSNSNGVTLDGLTLNNTTGSINDGSQSGIRVGGDDITIKNCTLNDHFVGIGIIAGGVDRLKTLANTFTNWKRSAIFVNFLSAASTGWRIAGNSILTSNAGSGQLNSGISMNFLNCSDMVIEKNFFQDNQSFGIQLYMTDNVSYDVLYNEFQDCGDDSSVGFGSDNAAIYLGGGANFVGFTGYTGSIQVGDFEIAYNWIQGFGHSGGGNGQAGIYSDDTASGANIHDNVIVGVRFSDYCIWNHGGSSITANNNIGFMYNGTTPNGNPGTKFLNTQGQDDSGALIAGYDMINNAVTTNIMLSVDSNGDAAPYDDIHTGSSFNDRWAERAGQGVANYNDPQTISGNIEGENVGLYSEAGETEGDRETFTGDGPFADVSNLDLTISTLPGAFTHIPGVTTNSSSPLYGLNDFDVGDY